MTVINNDLTSSSNVTSRTYTKLTKESTLSEKTMLALESYVWTWSSALRTVPRKLPNSGKESERWDAIDQTALHGCAFHSHAPPSQAQRTETAARQTGGLRVTHARQTVKHLQLQWWKRACWQVILYAVSLSRFGLIHLWQASFLLRTSRTSDECAWVAWNWLME